MQMKSEDSTLLMNVDGKEVSLSKRKDEATEHMCRVMGVSKAIINYVLFCHQEESDWPLWTDQDVMNRFDKIFGTTEYNTALEKLRKKRKELESEVKDKSKCVKSENRIGLTDFSFWFSEVGLKEFEMIKKQVDSKKVELETNEKQLVKKQQEHEKRDKAIEPMEKELNRILQIEQNLGKLVAERAKVETE